MCRTNDEQLNTSRQDGIEKLTNCQIQKETAGQKKVDSNF